MSSITVYGSNYREWAEHGLKDFGDFSDCIEYVNQTEDYCDSLAGEWYYCDDDALVIYSGTFGNYNSPGASHYMSAEVYDRDGEGRAAYEKDKAGWESQDEYLPSEDEEEGFWEDEEDEEYVDHSCNQCQALMINGMYCHEIGCHNQGKVKVDGEWVRPDEDEDEHEFDTLSDDA